MPLVPARRRCRRVARGLSPGASPAGAASCRPSVAGRRRPRRPCWELLVQRGFGDSDRSVHRTRSTARSGCGCGVTAFQRHPVQRDAFCSTASAKGCSGAALMAWISGRSGSAPWASRSGRGRGYASRSRNSGNGVGGRDGFPSSSAATRSRTSAIRSPAPSGLGEQNVARQLAGDLVREPLAEGFHRGLHRTGEALPEVAHRRPHLDLRRVHRRVWSAGPGRGHRQGRQSPGRLPQGFSQLEQRTRPSVQAVVPTPAEPCRVGPALVARRPSLEAQRAIMSQQAPYVSEGTSGAPGATQALHGGRAPAQCTATPAARVT